MLILTSCSSSNSLVLDAANPIEIEYEFNDASVPPEYHRSYVINVTETEVHVTVDSYEDVLADEKYTLSNTTFDALIETINEAILVSGRNEPSEPCSGGTSENLSINESGKEVYNGFFDNCADDAPSSMGEVYNVINAVHELVPNLRELLK